MTGVYLTWLADALRAAGAQVVEYDGWRTRARSSGGYAAGRPWCVMWHHTASKTSPANDASYMCHGADARPVANVLVARDGAVWVLAAGATNTNGKGRASTFSRGTVPADSMNSYAFGMELANAGTGEQYPQVQIDAAFIVSNVVNVRCGNRPDDVGVHEWYSPGRKIDPASCNVAGPWRPDQWNNSGTWELFSLRDECVRRAAGPTPPDPIPDPMEDVDMRVFLVPGDTSRAPMLLGPGWRHWARSQEEADVMLNAYGPAVELDARNYDVVASMCAAPSDGWP